MQFFDHQRVELNQCTHSIRFLACSTRRAIMAVIFLLVVAQAARAQWTQRATSGPPARTFAAMAFDTRRNVAVLFGGRLPSGEVLSDTWEWNGTQWTQMQVSGPSSRYNHCMTYDSARGVTVLFGGAVPALSGPSNETWEWNGSVWTLRTTTGPTPRATQSLVFDSVRNVSVLFGRQTSVSSICETWEWNGVDWSFRTADGPSQRYFHSAAFDSRRGVTVVYGGTTGTTGIAETWEWNGSTWTLRNVAGPPAVGMAAMDFDTARGVTVLFGGTAGTYKETWEFNGTTWTRRADGPPRIGHTMVFDSLRGESVVFGGAGGDTYADTWTWNGRCTLSITEQPVSTQICTQSNCSFSVGISGDPATYQWRHRNAPIAGATLPVLNISNATAADSGEYDCIVVNPCGSTISAAAILTVDPTPAVQSQPAPQLLIPGTQASFTFSITGTGLRYQWRRNGTALSDTTRITGTNASTLVINAVQGSDQGGYDCIVTSAHCGTMSSATAPLICTPLITAQPPSRANLVAGLTLSVGVPAGAPYSFRWRQNGQNLFNVPGVFSGVATRTLTLLSDDPSMVGTYDCILTSACGTSPSGQVTIPCPADFNADGGVDGPDIESFILEWMTGESDADINLDGGVDGMDVERFFVRWESGC